MAWAYQFSNSQYILQPCRPLDWPHVDCRYQTWSQNETTSKKSAPQKLTCCCNGNQGLCPALAQISRCFAAAVQGHCWADQEGQDGRGQPEKQGRMFCQCNGKNGVRTAKWVRFAKICVVASASEPTPASTLIYISTGISTVQLCRSMKDLYICKALVSRLAFRGFLPNPIHL